MVEYPSKVVISLLSSARTAAEAQILMTDSMVTKL